MNLRIDYATTYRYATPVADNLNALRVKPASSSTQRLDDFSVRVDPEARMHRHDDYFGTEVIEFGVVAPHESLRVDARAHVTTSAPPEPPEASWQALEARSYEDVGGEFLLRAGPLPADGALDELHAAARARTPLATLKLICELVPDRFEYRRGVTYVGSTIADLLEAGAGVCQDFVHLALELLRRQGIAARYVSGYLFATGEEGGRDSVEVDTHAWVEALMPASGGAGEPSWIGADPTNGGLAGERYVKIGHGRHYPDVPPIKGVYRGAAAAEHEVAVRMHRLDPKSSASV